MRKDAAAQQELLLSGWINWVECVPEFEKVAEAAEAGVQCTVVGRRQCRFQEKQRVRAAKATPLPIRKTPDDHPSSTVAVPDQLVKACVRLLLQEGWGEILPTLNAIVRIASDMLIISCLSFASLVLASRNSSRESPTCREEGVVDNRLKTYTCATCIMYHAPPWPE